MEMTESQKDTLIAKFAAQFVPGKGILRRFIDKYPELTNELIDAAVECEKEEKWLSHKL